MEQKATTAIGNLAELLTRNRFDINWDELFEKIGVKKPFETSTTKHAFRTDPNDFESAKHYFCHFFEKDSEAFIALLGAIINRDDRGIDGETIKKIDSYLAEIKYKIVIDSAGIKRIVAVNDFTWLEPWPEVYKACLGAEAAILKKPIDWETTCINQIRTAYERLLRIETGEKEKHIASDGGVIDICVKLIEQHTSIDIKQAETETKYLKSFYNFLSTHGTHSPATNAQDAEHAFVIGPSLLRWMLRRLRKIP